MPGANPCAPPDSPAAPAAVVQSTRGLRHYFLLMLTVFMFSYASGAVPLLWEWTGKGMMAPFAGLSLVAGWICLLVGVMRSFYRPWLGNVAFCIALATLGVFLFCCLRDAGVSLEDERLLGTFVIIAIWSLGLAAWGAFMSFRVVK